MMRHPAFGLGLALLGALTITPDALFMRWSGMSGVQMQAWRGLCMGGLFLAVWAVSSRSPRRDLAVLATGAGLTVIVSQFFNASLFAIGIAQAPVTIILMGVATAPVWAALISALVFGERTRAATWYAIACVLVGIAIAVSGKATGPYDARGVAFGVACGLGVAFALATTFAVLRHNRDLPLLPAIGAGALAAGLAGLLLTGPGQMMQGEVWAILVTGLVILPGSFFALSLASRHTAAANVSLVMLIETVLGPLWVWIGIGEAPSTQMIAGGAIVLSTLTVYLWTQSRAAARARRV